MVRLISRKVSRAIRKAFIKGEEHVSISHYLQSTHTRARTHIHTRARTHARTNSHTLAYYFLSPPPPGAIGKANIALSLPHVHGTNAHARTQIQPCTQAQNTHSYLLFLTLYHPPPSRPIGR